MRRLKPQSQRSQQDPLRAIYAFSGDPITFGHLDIVQRAARTYDEVVVAIGENPDKAGRYLFSQAERLAFAQRALAHLPNVGCVIFSGLLGEYAYRHGFDVIVRGVRNASDLESEMVLFSVIESIHPTLDIVFFPTRPELSHISSSVVKAMVAEGGDVSEYCPLFVKQELEQRLLGKFFVGVAGGIAAGKTYLAKRLVEVLRRRVSATYISLDEIGHYILANTEKPLYARTRQQIAAAFGPQVQRPDSSIDRKLLGRIVFHDTAALARLNQIMREPMLARLYEETREAPPGITVIEGAILVEACWTKIVNNNVILVDAPADVRHRRLRQDRDVPDDEAHAKIARQPTAADRRAALEHNIREHGWGRIWAVDNSDGEPDCEKLAGDLLKACPPEALRRPPA
jgi:pantetheine-phosphate adenylyltransferase